MRKTGEYYSRSILFPPSTGSVFYFNKVDTAEWIQQLFYHKLYVDSLGFMKRSQDCSHSVWASCDWPGQSREEGEGRDGEGSGEDCRRKNE